jgi:hypothetical protein
VGEAGLVMNCSLIKSAGYEERKGEGRKGDMDPTPIF